MKKRLGRILAAVGIMAILCVILTACVGPVGRNQAPVANFIVQTGSKTLNVVFYGSSSFDPDGEIVLWNWDFGDGEENSGITVAHTYKDPGTYPVRLQVRDNDGARDETTRNIIVAELEPITTDPVASFRFYDCDDQPQTGSAICFNGKRSYDPDGWITWGYWSFGDGSMTDGSWTEWVGGMEFSVMREVTHTYTKLGLYTVVLVIFDNEGNAATKVRTIKVK